ncbi:MAG: hypothetical protein RL684_430, partial [Pseudomonadota bacterium]
QHPLWLLPIGVAYFGVYYVLFRYGIRRLNLATPGREAQDAAAVAAGDAPAASGSEAAAFVRALGGAANLRSVDACTTRLRLEVVDSARVDGDALAALGALGVVRPSVHAAQVVLGPIADQVAGEIRRELLLPAASTTADASSWLQALGGVANLGAVQAAGGRLLLALHDADAVDAAALALLAPRGVARTRTGEWQLLLGEQAGTVAAALQASLSR